MTATTTPMTFSQLLRERSWDAHQNAEGDGFMQRLLAGNVDQAGYASMVAQHHAVYTALETVGATMSDDPVASAFVDAALLRVPSLEADLAHLYGTDWSAHIEVLPATRAYVDRILATADWPGGFVAHHYTRYLGDLSGGLAIGAAVARAYGLAPGTDGVSFYHFVDIPKPKPYKDRYRAALDAAKWSPAECDRVIDEVLVAYRLNTDLFADLTRSTTT